MDKYYIILSMIGFIIGIVTHKIKINIQNKIKNKKLNKEEKIDANNNRQKLAIWTGKNHMDKNACNDQNKLKIHNINDNQSIEYIYPYTEIGTIQFNVAKNSGPGWEKQFNIYYKDGTYITSEPVNIREIEFLDTEDYLHIYTKKDKKDKKDKKLKKK